MAGKRHLPQTGILGRRIAPSDPALRTHRKSATASDVPTHILLQIDHAPNPITTIGYAIEQSLVLGRPDPSSDKTVNVDLAPYYATEYGVSRRHIEIVRKEDALWARDLGSRNGSYLNDEPLGPDLVRLNDGDALILGGLLILIWFIFADQK